jgi:hypothetical protein
MRPPRYLALYRRLFGSVSAYWPCSVQNSDDGYDLRMDSLAGCPDEVMLGIAEVSALAHWKAQEQQNGSLSMRELIRRGDAIEQQLRAHTGPDFFTDIDQAPLHPSLPGAAGVDYNAVSPTMHATLSSPQSPHTIVPFPTEDMRRLVAGIFREAVILYLHMVLSDPVPGMYPNYFTISSNTHVAFAHCRCTRNQYLCRYDHSIIQSIAIVGGRSVSSASPVPRRLPNQ